MSIQNTKILGTFDVVNLITNTLVEEVTKSLGMGSTVIIHWDNSLGVEQIMELLEICLRTMYSTVPLIQLYWLSRRPNSLALDENFFWKSATFDSLCVLILCYLDFTEPTKLS